MPAKPCVVSEMNKRDKHLSQQSGRSQQVQVQHHVQHEVTIFDPEVVKSYSLMVPDAPERIFNMLEENNKTERELRRLPFAESQRRDWMGFIYRNNLYIFCLHCFRMA